MPEVSIIINCLNGERYVRETIESVYAQTFTDWEIVFWDNASTDNTAETANSFDEKVRYFRAETTADLGPARCLAYKQATGDYVAILDADDIWLPEKLERQVALFKTNPKLGLVYCDSYMFDGGGDRFRLFQAGQPKRGKVLGDLIAANFIFTSTMMFSRAKMAEMDYVFDDQFTRAQDYELTLRVAYHFEVDYVPEALSRWRMYQDNKQWKDWKASLIPRVVEVKMAIENLVEAHPDIATTYPSELQACYKGLDYNFGITAWQAGKRSEARSYLSRYLQDKKYAFVYLCTFVMPFGVFERLKSFYRNTVTGRMKPKLS